MPEENQEIIFSPQPGPQSLLLMCQSPFIFFGGARGGGKSFGAVLKIHQHGDAYGKHGKILVIRRSYPELENFQAECQNVLPMLGWTYKVGAKTWTHENGATCKLRFLESDADADMYQGHQYTLIVIEELGNFKSATPIRKLIATMRSAAGVPTQLLATGNPGGPGHQMCKEWFIDPAPPLTIFPDLLTGRDTIFIPSKLEDNLILMENDPLYSKNLDGAGPAWLVDAWKNGNWDISPGGNIFRREYWEYYNEPPKFLRIVQSWDTAFKKGQDNDRSCCTTWGATATDFYLLHCWVDKVEFPELKRVAKNLAAEWHPHVIYVEDKASGQSLIQELKRETSLPLKAVKVDKDKVARAYAVTPLVEGGKVKLPNTKDKWLHEFVEELSVFPEGRYDDIVDSTSQALDRLSHYTKTLENFSRKVVPLKGSIFGR